jgi:tRNA threonylcarbamoyladenosine modification (KEOPS) complex Cgi121 subunit
MLHHFEEFNIYAEISGFRGIKFEQAEAFLKSNRKTVQNGVWIQFFDADLIATEQHLYFAVLNALAAFKNQTNLSKSLAMEAMLYASAQRQIQKAIGLLGIKPETSDLAVVIIGEKPEALEAMLKETAVYLHTEVDDSVLEISPKKLVKIRETFEITAPMLEVAAKQEKCGSAAVVDLVIEKMALLSTQL